MTINPIWGHITGVLIALMMVSFIGIWIWAWRKYHKPTFNRMALLPMEDEPETDVRNGENHP